MASLMKYADDARSTLASGVSAVDTFIQVTSAASFPAIAGEEWFPATLYRLSDGQKETVRVTAVLGETFTIDRDFYADTSLAFEANDRISIRMNQAILDAYPQYRKFDTYEDMQAHMPRVGEECYLVEHTSGSKAGGGRFIARAGAFTTDYGTTYVPDGGDGSVAWVRDIGASEYIIHPGNTVAEIEAIVAKANADGDQAAETRSGNQANIFRFIPGNYSFDEQINFDVPGSSYVDARGCYFECTHNGVLFDLNPNHELVSNPGGWAKQHVFWNGGRFISTNATNTATVAIKAYSMRNFDICDARIDFFHTGIKIAGKDTYGINRCFLYRNNIGVHMPQEIVSSNDRIINVIFYQTHIDVGKSGDYDYGVLIEDNFIGIFFIGGSANGNAAQHLISVDVDAVPNPRGLHFKGYHVEQSSNPIFIRNRAAGQVIETVTFQGGDYTTFGDHADVVTIECQRVRGLTIDGVNFGGLGTNSTKHLKVDNTVSWIKLPDSGWLADTNYAFDKLDLGLGATACPRHRIQFGSPIKGYYETLLGFKIGSITNATQTNPVVLTFSDLHYFENGNEIWVEDVTGMTEINDRRFTVANVTDTTLELSGEDGTGHTTYVSGGTASRCFYAFNDTTIDMSELSSQWGSQWGYYPRGYNVSMTVRDTSTGALNSYAKLCKGGSATPVVAVNMEGRTGDEDHYMSGTVDCDENGDLRLLTQSSATGGALVIRLAIVNAMF